MALALLALAGLAAADVYMHNPRGSNDRNCERNENRNNGNRLFDSQNNDKGGYACPRAVGGPSVVTPRMYYYAGSKLSIEWTNQHGCGDNENVHCNIVLQYMCNDETGNPLLRDGTPSDAQDSATDRIPEDTPSALTDPRYGYHETWDFYLACRTRNRNGGLWVADQRVGSKAINTRQNPNGNRRGLECPEERDYYPYWHPSPWKDIAVLTYETDRCDYYKSNSENRKGRWMCVVPPTTAGASAGPSMYNSEVECIAAGHQWTEFPSHGLDAPKCEQAPWSRDNHLGNGKGGFADTYNWTIPNTPATGCVLRLRYNISTAETSWDYWAAQNSDMSPIKQDPYVDIGLGWNVSLAVNTNQYGRTFQDRSYVFEIREASGAGKCDGTLYNLNVRGKRGNIVQTYPAVEYDFVPNYLHVSKGDCIHFQWTGSDYNPNRQPNNAEGGPTDPAQNGNYRADRSNIIPVTRRHHIPKWGEDVGLWSADRSEIMSLAYINQDLGVCKSYSELMALNGNNEDSVDKDSRNCMKLNAAPTPYFDLAPLKMAKIGTFTYMSSRNDNFSNRSQKAAIFVDDPLTSGEAAGIAVGVSIAVAGASAAGAFVYAKKNPGSKVAGLLGKLYRR